MMFTGRSVFDRQAVSVATVKNTRKTGEKRTKIRIITRKPMVAENGGLRGDPNKRKEELLTSADDSKNDGKENDRGVHKCARTNR